jgi:succinate dehydrogenase (ubiquinone) cytochrome b560 subunit
MSVARSLQVFGVARAVGRVGLRTGVRGVATRVPTTPMTPDENLALLNAQRLRRPSSPHFTIYQPQYTWLLSIANRFTGAGLSARK